MLFFVYQSTLAALPGHKMVGTNEKVFPCLWSLCWLRKLLCFLLWIILFTDKTTGRTDYCQFETFNATCKNNQVVLMEHARYGRMQLGRCVAKSFGHIGCAANVLDLIDKDCSGRKKCRISVPALADLIQPCPTDLKLYLEADYGCIDVSSIDHNSCNQTIHLNSKNSTIYISADSNKFISTRCQIRVQALPGQKLNFTLYKFGDENTINDGFKMCPLTIALTGPDGHGKDVEVCKLAQREQIIHSSLNSSTSIYFHRTDIQRASRTFLKIEAIGCPDLEVPPNAWVDRKGEKAMVKCNHTQETWYVTCTGKSWTGHVTNCTPGTTETSARKGHISLGLVVAVTIGIILGVMFGIAMLITVFVYRRKKAPSTSSKTTSLLGGVTTDEASQDNEENYARRVWIEHKHDDPYGRICRGHNAPPQYSSSSTDYSHMFELQCSGRSPTPGSGDYHVDNPYGQCAHRISGGRVSADDIHTCSTMPLSALTANSSNSPSFATFKAERSAPRQSPNKTLTSNRTPRTESRTLGSFRNKTHSLSSVEELDDVTSPEHQPDLVTSNNADRLGGMFNEPPEQ